MNSTTGCLHSENAYWNSITTSAEASASLRMACKVPPGMTPLGLKIGLYRFLTGEYPNASIPPTPTHHPKIFTLSAPNDFMPILYQRDRQGFALRL